LVLIFQCFIFTFNHTANAFSCFKTGDELKSHKDSDEHKASMEKFRIQSEIVDPVPIGRKRRQPDAPSVLPPPKCVRKGLALAPEAVSCSKCNLVFNTSYHYDAHLESHFHKSGVVVYRYPGSML
jgi:hypothetical protein